MSQSTGGGARKPIAPDTMHDSRPTRHQQAIERAMRDYDRTGLCRTAGPCDCRVEAEGRCYHGAASILLAAGLA